MEDIALVNILRDIKHRPLNDKAHIVKLLAIDQFQQHEVKIAICLWLIALCLIHINNWYSFGVTDILPLMGFVAAAASVVIAEKQLTTWKQEKILERLETVLTSSVKLRNLCSALEVNGLRDSSGNYRFSDFRDEDISNGAELIDLDLLNCAEISEECKTISHQLTFMAKIVGDRSFRFQSKKNSVGFFFLTKNYLSSLSSLVQTYENVSGKNEGEFQHFYQPGTHGDTLNQHYAFWRSFNEDRNGRIDESTLIVPPTFFIHLRITQMISALRV